MAAIDIPHLVAATGDMLVEQNAGGPVLTFGIRKTAGPLGRSSFSRAGRHDGER
jgi:hypothetical protein